MNTKPTVSRFADRDKITIQPNTAAKAKEEKDDYKFSIISRGHFACDSIKTTYIIIDKAGKIGCSCGDMTYRCTNDHVCKHIAIYLDLDVPPQTPAPGELIRKLILMGWVGGKDDLHPAELLRETSADPEMSAGTVHYECPKCGETVDLDADKLQDWKLNHIDVCTGKHGQEATISKTEIVETPPAPHIDEEPMVPDEIMPSEPADIPVTTNLATALCNMQKIDLLAVTDSNNPFHNAKYADLAGVWAAIRKPLTDNGLAVMQTTEPYPSGITVVTTLLHTSGESYTARLSCEVPKSKPDKNGQVKPNIQGAWVHDHLPTEVLSHTNGRGGTGR